MKRARKVSFAKEADRSGRIFSAARSQPLPDWMQDPELLPKDPPHRKKKHNQPPEGDADA